MGKITIKASDKSVRRPAFALVKKPTQSATVTPPVIHATGVGRIPERNRYKKANAVISKNVSIVPSADEERGDDLTNK